jgi:hypothetical protein
MNHDIIVILPDCYLTWRRKLREDKCAARYWFRDLTARRGSTRWTSLRKQGGLVKIAQCVVFFVVKIAHSGNQVFLRLGSCSQKMRCKSFGELRFVAEHPHHGGLIQSRNYGVFHSPGGRNAPRPSGQTALADKISGFEVTWLFLHGTSTPVRSFLPSLRVAAPN